jgi:hypothetical protein
VIPELWAIECSVTVRARFAINTYLGGALNRLRNNYSDRSENVEISETSGSKALKGPG